jgi:hypothetical protein
MTDGQGNSFVHTQGQTAYHYTSAGDASSSGTALGEMRNHSAAQSESYNRSIQTLRGVANAIGRSASETATRQAGTNQEIGEGHGTSEAVGENESTTIADTDTVSQSRAKMHGLSRSQGRTLSIGRTHEIALAEAFTQIQQFTNSYSQALQKTTSRTSTVGGSQGESVSIGSEEGETTGESTSRALTERKVFFTLEGEREITINDLQRLPQRHCVIAKEALAATEIGVLKVPDRFYSYRDHNLPAEILARQRMRLLPEEPSTARLESVRHQTEPDDHSPWEF